MPDPALTVLDRHAARLRAKHLKTLFAEDFDRFAAFSAEGCGLLLDFSKEKLDLAALSELIGLARASGVEGARDAMLSGKVVNTTEGRAVLHTALRLPEGAAPPEGVDLAEVHAERSRMLGFAEQIRADPQITDVVNLGIGGSDLGPAMAARALRPWHGSTRVHFVANVDPSDLSDTLAGLDPARTLLVVASKSFTTLETLTNARVARAWLGDGAGTRMVAVTSRPDAAIEFGVEPGRIFRMWDWVGGRFSLWSSMGMPLAIAIGSVPFEEMLAGAHAMDRHFAEKPFDENLPVLMALIAVWRRCAMGYGAVALVPYDQRLDRFAAYLQQLDMESNGKSVTRGGMPVPHATAPVVFGEPGTNAQHSFFQLLHQGTDPVPVDFMVPAEGVGTDPAQHQMLVASALAQSAALAFGEDAEDPHRHFPGDRPSSTLVYPRLDPAVLGSLIALFEHRTAVQGVIWDINSFDQFGVELGKRLTAEILPQLRGERALSCDSSTAGLIKALGREGS